jgi:preflagellin peptidase FlaK
MNLLQILVSLTFLTIASVYDLKTMEVPNKIWAFFLPVSLITTTVHMLNNPNHFPLTLASIAITTIIALTIFYFGLYGGADAKALITLSVAHPITSSPTLIFPLIPLITFNNSLLLMVLMLPVAFIRNLYWKFQNRQTLFQGLEREPFWRKIAALFLCVKTSKSKIKPYHMLAETFNHVDGELYRTLKIFQRVEEENSSISDAFLPESVFIVYSLPMLPFLTLAYILSITVGDLILHLITSLL